MSFNFEQAIKESNESQTSGLVSAIILGPSGAGKSTLMGSFGVKTLYLHTTGESHGPKSARSIGADLITICIDQSGGESLSADASYARLLDILSDVGGLRKLGVGAVALDGATEIEAIIRNTQKWESKCQSASGKHNGFAEPAATIELFRPILVALKRLQSELKVHVAMTCILEVKDIGPNGEILESAPRLVGYSVAENIVQQFDDVLVVGRMTKGDTVKHKIQMLSEVTKVAKDVLGTVKKTFNFAPRLSGLMVQDLPALIDADLSKVIELKRKVKGAK